jgi:Spy/CpxP family protein refolding chaperone
MKKTAVIVLSLVVLVGASSAAMAGRWGRGPGRGPMVQQLTAEQMTKLQEFRAAHMKETLELRQSRTTKSQAMRTMMMQKDADLAKIKALAYELVDIRGQLAKKRIEHALKVKTELGIDLPMRGFGGSGGKKGQRRGMGRYNGFGPQQSGMQARGYGRRMGQGYGMGGRTW